MCGVGIEPREPPVFHAGDASAAGDAQAAKAGYPRSRGCAHGLLPCPGAIPRRAPGRDAGHCAAFYTRFRRGPQDRLSLGGAEQDSSQRTETILRCPLFVALIGQQTIRFRPVPLGARLSAIAAARTERRWPASRPTEASKAAVCYVRNTSIRDVRLPGRRLRAGPLLRWKLASRTVRPGASVTSRERTGTDHYRPILGATLKRRLMRRG